LTTIATPSPLRRWARTWPWRFDATEHRTRGDARSRQPGLQRTHRAGVRPRAIRNADATPLAFLVGLRALLADDHASAADVQVVDVDGHQLAATERAGEANQQERAIAQLELAPCLTAPR
jgi:hypothetical protein